jgi:hypothetical protein
LLPEGGQAICRLLAARRRRAGQHHPENFSVLRLGRPPLFSRADAQLPDEGVVEIRTVRVAMAACIMLSLLRLPSFQHISADQGNARPPGAADHFGDLASVTGLPVTRTLVDVP